jgi:hypothetical protein
MAAVEVRGSPHTTIEEEISEEISCLNIRGLSLSTWKPFPQRAHLFPIDASRIQQRLVKARLWLLELSARLATRLAIIAFENSPWAA